MSSLTGKPRFLEPSRIAGTLMLASIFGVALYVAVRAASFSLRPAAPELGQQAPRFSAPTLAGDFISIDELRGRVVVLEFWATWCSGCVAFMPIVDRLERDYRARGLTWVAIHLAPAQPEQVRAFLGARDFVTLIDPGGVAERYGIFSTPSYVVLDRAGRVHAVFHSMASEPQLRKVIEALLARPS